MVKKGHLMKNCRLKKNVDTVRIEEKKIERLYAMLKVNGKTMQFHVDTGSDLNDYL